MSANTTYFDVHRVGYVSLRLLEEQVGKAARKVIEECARDSASSDVDQHPEFTIQFEELGIRLGEWMEANPRKKSLHKIIKKFIENAIQRNATGDLLIYV